MGDHRRFGPCEAGFQVVGSWFKAQKSTLFPIKNVISYFFPIKKNGIKWGHIGLEI